MALTTYDWVYGIAQLAAAFLAIIAGVIAWNLFLLSRKKGFLAWKYLSMALILFVAVEVLGALRSFGVYQNIWITHVLVSVLLGVLIVALVAQINANKGWT
ncbi:hypothetical protein HY642_04750 [Candidatus Woesearchaeota archaeon]|nr:hypothetical protein [Candidatus Woesearchaeota archaeon]